MRDFNTIEKYRVEIYLKSPMHMGGATGDRSEVLIHPISGYPFVQATSLAGILRDASLRIHGSKETDILFGSALDDSDMGTGSKINISDGVFFPETIHMECRPRVKIDPSTGTVSAAKIAGSGQESGHRFEMELIGSGAEFVFFIYLFHDNNDNCQGKLEEILAELAAGHLQAGGQKSNGGGVLGLKGLWHRRFVMSDERDRKAYMAEHKMDDKFHVKYEEYEDRTGQLPLFVKNLNSYEITITGMTEGGLLVKGASVARFGEGAPDVENMKNVLGEYIIPGSSLKGALRNHITTIAAELDKKGIIPHIFGSAGNDSAPANRGNIIVKDTIVGEQQDVKTLLQHRIHIDKFTGGVIHGELFAEETISGNLVMKMDIENRFDPEATAGFVLMAVRDMAAGLWNLGSGYSTGRGFIKVKDLTICSADDKKTVIDFANGKIEDPYGQIQIFLEAVKSWEVM